MRTSELFKTAWKALMANKKRSILTMSGIIIGIAAVITIISLGNGIRQATLKNLQATQGGEQTTQIYYMSNDTNGDDQGITQDDLSTINNAHFRGLARVKLQQSNEYKQIRSQIGRRDTVLSTKLINKPQDIHVVAGHNLTSYDFAVQNPVVLISESLAQHEFHSATQALDQPLLVGQTSYQIKGVMSTPEDETQVFLPRRAYLSGQTNNQSDTIILTFDKGTDAAATTKQVLRLLRKNGVNRYAGTYDYDDTGKILKGISKVIDALTYFIGAVAGISLIIAGIGVMNMMYISVSERTQEIGIRLAIGARPRTIMLQFLLEAVMLTTLGGIIGFLDGAGLAYGIALALPFKAKMSVSSFVVAFIVSSTVGIIFGILPAKQAANKNLIDILR